MGEALIIRSGGGYSNGGYIPKTEIITNNYSFKVPNAKGQQFAVRIFGGGGAMGRNGGGGGGGNMNYAVLKLNENELIDIVIGNASNKWSNNPNGGTTSFGTYLSATGGECGNRFSGGNGGTGGGSTVGTIYSVTHVNGTGVNGGHGFYGGGGGFAGYAQNSNNYTYSNINDSYSFGNDPEKTPHGGNGGTYGGGGGGPIFGVSVGGWGHGGNNTIEATDGLNTIGKELDFEGSGFHGTCNMYSVINTFGNNNGYYNMDSKYSHNIYAGGGGYGGNGGNSSKYSKLDICGGGGGGFGAKGGDGGIAGGGGGGGWGGKGGSGKIVNNCFGDKGAGYGGGYGPDGYGRGTGWDGLNVFNAMPGICIISYMQALQS